MTQVLEINHLAKTFKDKVVLKDITFSVQSGEIIALLGENGAGKSTLINCMNYLIKKDSGDIKLFKEETISSQIRNRIGVMLQKNIVIPKLKVKEMLELSCSYYTNPVSFQQLVEWGQLDELLELEVSALSGGQQRRLSFSLALVGNPDLIFLDEPTANMDAKSRRKLWDTVSHIQSIGKTIIVTSHHLEELESIATRILILQKGMIAFDGSICQLRDRLGQGFIEFDSSLMREAFADISAVIRLERRGNHYVMTTKDINQVVKELVPLLDKITNLTIQQTSLETLFNHYGEEK